jgi:GDPmannose 4,6-dehydratase
VNYREAYGMFASSGILFNHESPRRGETFVTRKIVSAALRITSGTQKVLFLGNLDAIRDWGHAKDYVEGMWRILQHSAPDDFVLATGVAISVREFVEKVFEKVGNPIKWEGQGVDEVGKNSSGETVIRIDPKYFRPTEVPFLLGDASKARTLLGWKPVHTLDDLIDDMISGDRVH